MLCTLASFSSIAIRTASPFGSRRPDKSTVVSTLPAPSETLVTGMRLPGGPARRQFPPGICGRRAGAQRQMVSRPHRSGGALRTPLLEVGGGPRGHLPRQPEHLPRNGNDHEKEYDGLHVSAPAYLEGPSCPHDAGNVQPGRQQARRLASHARDLLDCQAADGPR